MKFLIFLLIILKLNAEESKKMEWFPSNLQEQVRKNPCRGELLKNEIWPYNLIKENQSLERKTTSCELFHIDL
jgi:hypothetical protein